MFLGASCHLRRPWDTLAQPPAGSLTIHLTVSIPGDSSPHLWEGTGGDMAGLRSGWGCLEAQVTAKGCPVVPSPQGHHQG